MVFTPDPLKSDDALTVALALSDRQIEIIKNDTSLGNHLVAEALQELRAIVWGNGRSVKPLTGIDKEKAEQKFNAVMARLDDPKNRELLLSSYARMGHLYEIAALTARDNYFHNQKKIPGGVGEFVAESREPLAQIVEKLNRPVFEVTMTQHPTNVNSLESMQAQREIARAVESGDGARLDEAIRKYQHTPVLHQVDGRDANLTVREETLNVLNFLGNIYEDMPRVYKRYDEALAKKSPDYDPASLKLRAHFGSWGSAGDKDGNKNVTAETTLEAIALHTQAVLSRYAADIARMNDPALDSWQAGFVHALRKLEPLTREIGQLREDSDAVRRKKAPAPPAEALDKRFDALSHRLSRLRAELKEPIKGKDFETALADSYAAGKDPKVLDLLRKYRMFGFSFSKIEYRETAGQYSRVVGLLYDSQPGVARPYHELSPQEKKDALTQLLSQPGKAAQMLAAMRADIQRGAGTAYADQNPKKPYNAELALPIAYHSVKRMELARDFPDVIRDNVLAECGQYDKTRIEPDTKGNERIVHLDPTPEETMAQGTANLLEAQFLQEAAAKDGRRPLLGIVPLFEEPATMQNIDGIMAAAYENPAYKAHMQRVSDSRGEALTQQVQIAHSDNARRAGLQAARAFIHDAHDKLRAVNKAHGVATQFFEGGSMSDPYRNGVRSVSGIVNDFSLHDFAKFTFQGGDLLTYFNDPRSTERLFTRNLTHQARHIEKVDGIWRTTERPEGAVGGGLDMVADRVARKALQATLPDYDQQDFQTSTMGLLLALLGYNNEVRAGGRGSRAKGRTAENEPESPYLEPINIVKDVRTIGFSEAMQHNGLVPTWVGSHDLERHLKLAIRELAANPDKTPEERIFLERLGATQENQQLKAEQLQYFYKNSPTFRDAQDRAAFGHALSDMNALESIVNKKFADMEEKQVRLQKGWPLRKQDKALPDMTAMQKMQVRDYLNQLKRDYITTSRIAYAAHKGQDMPMEGTVAGSFDGWMNRISHIWKKIVSHALPHLEKDIVTKRSFRDFLLHLKIHEGAALDDHLQGLAHAAGDTVMHGRWLAADDRAYGQHLSAQRGAGLA